MDEAPLIEASTLDAEPLSYGSQRTAKPLSYDPQSPAEPLSYGPQRPAELGNVGYKHFTNKKYLKGYAHKILVDLTKVARMYNGHEARIFGVAKKTRCPTCTNMATGERLMTNCPTCHGTGYQDSWDLIGDFWTYVDFGPNYKMATPYGNTENPNGVKTGIIILGAPLLKDQSLLIFKESKEIFKIYDVEPHIVAMRGDVISQVAQSTRLTPGSIEYKLIDW